jgi:CheY-like chemotaxis protein
VVWFRSTWRLQNPRFKRPSHSSSRLDEIYTRVLIVDGDKEVISALERVFADQTEYVIHTSDNPFTAGLECERFRPHVMLFDLSICGDNYASFAKAFQGNAELQATKVIAMTGRLTDGQMTHLTCSGFDGVLSKPFTVRQVIDAIENAVALVYWLLSFWFSNEPVCDIRPRSFAGSCCIGIMSICVLAFFN